MTIREIIKNFETVISEYQAENQRLKDELKKVTIEKKRLEAELKSLKPTVEEVESQLTAVVAGDTVSVDDVVEEQKSKKSRKKKIVEPVEEPIENV